MKKINKFILLILIILPIFVLSKENFNIGLVKGLWLSDTEVFAEDKTFINTVFFNDSDFDIAGTVIFYDNDEEIFKERVIVKQNALQQIRAPYTVMAGVRSFKANIDKVRKIEDGEETEEITSENGFELGTEKIEIDFDTDNDGVGNMEDADDDGDGYSDKEEKEKNSDPLDENSIPENIEQNNIEEVIKEVKTASDNIFTRAETFRINTASIIEKEILEKETEIKNSEARLLKNEKESVDGKIIIKNNVEQKETKTNFYLIFLKFLHTIFNSVILSIIFFIVVVWILYRFTRIFF